MFRPEEPGGLGLTDTTGGTCVGRPRPRREPYFCPTGQIYAVAGRGMACLAMRGRVPGLYRGGESATVSRQIGSLSRKERARDAGRMAVEPRARFLPPRGKVLRFHGK